MSIDKKFPITFECANCGNKKDLYYEGTYECAKCRRKYKISKNITIFISNVEESKTRKYVANYIPLKVRVSAIILSLVFIFYSYSGAIKDDLVVSLSKRGRPYIHLHGFPMWLMIIAIVLIIVLFITIIVDHYDKRDNEEKYKLFQKRIGTVMAVFFFSAIGLQLLVYLINWIMSFLSI